MRVGVVGPADEDDFAANILAGLSQLSIPAVSLGPAMVVPGGRNGKALAGALRRHPRVGPLLERNVVGRARDEQVDLVITVQSLRPETVQALRSNGSRVALWFPDHVANLGPLWMFDAPYDGLFFKEPALVRRLNALVKLPVHYLPEACNPLIHRPVDSSEASGKVVVVGNLHPIRARLLERLVDDEVPLAIYGPPLHRGLRARLAHLHTGRYVRGLAKSAVFGSSTAVLNGLHPSEIEGVNCRLFEATAAGGAVVSEYRSELRAFFDDGSEVLAYASYDELVEHLKWLLADPLRGRRLGEAASRRSLSQYTYAQRLTTLLEHTA